MAGEDDEEELKAKLQGAPTDPQLEEATPASTDPKGDKWDELSLATRFLRRLRTLAVRHLVIPGREVPPATCDDLPSTLVQVLAWEGDSGVDSGPPRLLFTSEVAHFTLNPSYLLLDLGIRADLPPRLHPHVCFRIVHAPPPGSDSAVGGDRGLRPSGADASEGSGALTPSEAVGFNASPPKVLREKGEVVLEFVVDVRTLWSLHPSIDLCQLRLAPSTSNALVLVTEEGGGRGPLVIQQHTYDALRHMHGPPAPPLSSSSPSPWSVVYGARVVDEAFLADLEDSHHHQHHTHHAMAVQSSEAAMQQTSLSQACTHTEDGQEAAERRKEERRTRRLRAEVQRLREMVCSEERLLKEEQRCLDREQEQIDFGTQLLRGLMERALSLEGKAAQAQTLMHTQQEDLTLRCFLLERRRVKLLTELSSLYPISRLDHSTDGIAGWAIRGVEVPWDLEKGVKEEEQAAAALGYVCHLVFMLAKYLQVPLRYSLEYKGSRSQVRDPAAEQGTRILPLYKTSGGGSGVTGGMMSKAGGGERESAVRCLCRDIYQLLQARGLEPQPTRHMLDNLQRLLFKEIGQQP